MADTDLWCYKFHITVAILCTSKMDSSQSQAINNKLMQIKFMWNFSMGEFKGMVIYLRILFLEGVKELILFKMLAHAHFVMLSNLFKPLAYKHQTHLSAFSINWKVLNFNK